LATQFLAAKRPAVCCAFRLTPQNPGQLCAKAGTTTVFYLRGAFGAAGDDLLQCEDADAVAEIAEAFA
jgi:hypothetical protein